MECPGAQGICDHDRVPALARRHVERVALERLRQRITVAREHLERQPVKMHRVDHLTLVHEAEADALAELRRVRSRGGEAFAVDGDAAELVVQDDELVLVVLRIDGSILRHDQERSKHPFADLFCGVVVRVVHVAAERARHELVGEGLAVLDRRLGEERDVVHVVGGALAVPVRGVRVDRAARAQPPIGTLR